MGSDTWTYGYKTIEYEFCIHIRKPSNQNILCTKYSILIECFWSTNTKFMLDSFKTVRPGLYVNYI